MIALCFLFSTYDFYFVSVCDSRQKQKHYVLLKTREKILGKQKREPKTIPSYLLFDSFVCFTTIAFGRSGCSPDHRAEIHTVRRHIVVPSKIPKRNLQLSASGVAFLRIAHSSSPQNFRKNRHTSGNAFLCILCYLFTSEGLTTNIVQNKMKRSHFSCC